MRRDYRLFQFECPEWVINKMLDNAGYYDEIILNKSVFNFCVGQGNILREVLKRYRIAIELVRDKDVSVIDPRLVIRGDEYDKLSMACSITKLNSWLVSLGFKYGISILFEDALESKVSNCDFIFCVPPFEFIVEPSNFEQRVRHERDKWQDTTSYYVKFLARAFGAAREDGVISFICPAEIFLSDRVKILLQKNSKFIDNVVFLYNNPFKIGKATVILTFKLNKEAKFIHIEKVLSQTTSRESQIRIGEETIDALGKMYLDDLFELSSSSKYPQYIQVTNNNAKTNHRFTFKLIEASYGFKIKRVARGSDIDSGIFLKSNRGQRLIKKIVNSFEFVEVFYSLTNKSQDEFLEALNNYVNFVANNIITFEWGPYNLA